MPFPNFHLPPRSGPLCLDEIHLSCFRWSKSFVEASVSQKHHIPLYFRLLYNFCAKIVSIVWLLAKNVNFNRKILVCFAFFNIFTLKFARKWCKSLQKIFYSCQIGLFRIEISHPSTVGQQAEIWSEKKI